MTTTLEESEGVASRPGRSLLPGKTRYPLYRGLGGPQGRSGRAENLAPPGFDPRTVQPVVSRYTVWATRSTSSQGNRQFIWRRCQQLRVGDKWINMEHWWKSKDEEKNRIICTETCHSATSSTKNPTSSGLGLKPPRWEAGEQQPEP